MTAPQPETPRQKWLRVLALSEWNDVKSATGLLDPAEFVTLRSPESGLVMLRGRMGGNGAAFNFGEAAITRCCVRSKAGHEGYGFVLGRNADHALAIARCDALLQDPAQAGALQRCIIAPLLAKLAARRREVAEKAAATKVDFFTMVRGDV